MSTNNEDFEEGELPDEDPLPSDSANISKPTTLEKSLNLLNQDDESSEVIIFETIAEKDYKYSPERKKKKIHKQEVKAKPKQKEKSDRSSFEKDKKIEKRKSPTPTPAAQEEAPPPPKRDFPQQPAPVPMPQPFYTPPMYLPPVYNMMPHMYPPQYPPLPYVHPPQFHYANAMPPTPNMPMNHPHYPMQPLPPMFAGFQPKQLPSMKQPIEGQNFKHHQQPQYPAHQIHHPQPIQQKYQHQPKVELPNYAFHAQPPNYLIPPNQNNKATLNIQPQNHPPVFPLPANPPPIQNNRPQLPDIPKEKEKNQGEIIREKKIDFKNKIKKEVKEALKSLPLQEQEELLEGIRCMLKYNHLSHSLFPSEEAIQTNASLSCFQKNVAKLERMIRAQGRSQQAEIVEKVLTSLQVKEPLLKIKERILYHKIINQNQRLQAQQLRLQLQQKGF